MKKFHLNLIALIVTVIAALLWVLSKAVDALSWFSFSAFVMVVCLIWGAIEIAKASVDKTIALVKKGYIFVGSLLIVFGILMCVWTFAVPSDFIAPLIVLILTAGLLISFIIVGGKKWDEGDNHQEGYLNYRERKALEEQKKAEEAKKLEEVVKQVEEQQ